MKQCSECGEEKLLSEFSKNVRSPDGHQTKCKLCRSLQDREYRKNNSEYCKSYPKKWRETNPEKAQEQSRRGHLWRKYKLTLENYSQMLEDSGGLCAICGLDMFSVGQGPNIDRCYTTGKVRGLLCNKCNVAIGFLNDDPDRIDKAAAYVRKWKGIHDES